MELLKTRTWSATDIGLLKAGTALFGIAVGLTLPKRCKSYAPLLLLGVAALAARPILHYFKHAEEPDPFFAEADERSPAQENL